MFVVLRHVEERGQALTEPHGYLSVGVDSKRLKTLLEATHGVVLKGARVFAQVHVANLRHAQAADGDKTWGRDSFSSSLKTSQRKELIRLSSN